MYLCILDASGQTVLHQDYPADAAAFLDAIAPYRDGLAVAVECMFAWYWLADLCHEHSIPFVLGHALYMKAIHQGKSKNDRLDAAKIAGLLRGGLLPQAYVYPKPMRATRDCCVAVRFWCAAAPTCSPTWSTLTASTTCRP
jgi:hypothetical protein